MTCKSNLLTCKLMMRICVSRKHRDKTMKYFASIIYAEIIFICQSFKCIKSMFMIDLTINIYDTYNIIFDT